MRVRFTPEMDIQIETRHGLISVRWHARSWSDKISYSVSVDAPFLLVPLFVGDAGFEPLSKVLNEISTNGEVRELTEILDMIALSDAPTYWLKVLAETKTDTVFLPESEEGIAHLQKKYKHLEKYRALAWSLKKQGYAVFEDNLLLLGEQSVLNRVYLIDKEGKIFGIADLHPKSIMKLLTSTRTTAPEREKTSEMMFIRDSKARQNFLKAASEIKDAWIERAVARLTALVLDAPG